MASERLLRWLCWALVISAVVAAVSQLLLTFNIWAGGPSEPDPNADLVTRLLVFRSNDQEIFPVVLIANIASIAAFIAIGLIGVALRPFAAGASMRDVMATLLIVGSVIGVLSQALNIGVAQTATRGYCDCGFKTEEVIAQDYSLTLGFIVQQWVNYAGLVIVALGVAVAGRLVAVSSAWRALSYVIAAIAFIAVALRIVASLVFIEGFDVFYWTDLLISLSIGILVPIWAIMLVRGVRAPESAA
jgi:hypothetical protein